MKLPTSKHLSRWIAVLASLALLLGSPGSGLPHESVAASGRGGAPCDGQDAKTGSVRGTFTCRQRLLTRGATSQRDVVVYLLSEEKKAYVPPAEPVVVKQSKLQFTPHVLPILRGTRIRFVNEDDVDHNVFSETCCPINLDMPPHSASPVAFEQVCVASLVCRLHPEMSLRVVVLDNPWFAHFELEKQKDPDSRAYAGEYEIRGVPPGNYKLTFWNKKLLAVEYPVTVAPDAKTVLDIVIEE